MLCCCMENKYMKWNEMKYLDVLLVTEKEFMWVLSSIMYGRDYTL